MTLRYIFTFIIVCFLSIANGQQIQKAKKGTFLLKNASIHTVTKGTIDGDVLIKDGKIAKVGKGLASSDATIINCSGKRIYPGFIDGGTKLGLQEIAAVSLTSDHRELGDFVPNMQTLTAINPNSVSIPVTRTNGVTTVIANPTGGLFPGTSSLIHLYGYTPENMYAGFKGVVLNFPHIRSGNKWFPTKRDKKKEKEQLEKALEKLNNIWDEAILYEQIDTKAKQQGIVREDFNLQMDALLPVIRGEFPLLVEVNKKKDITNALEWLKKKGIKNVILTGVQEGFKVTKELKEAGYPIVTGPIMGIPMKDSDRYDVAYKNAGLMTKAGLQVAIRTNETENVRNLPFNAGFAAAYGLGTEKAVAAITIIPAKIFGIADQVGSIEEGKIANLFICDGDPFEMKTTISKLFIRGFDVPIENRHTLLYDEFLDRVE